MPRISSTKTLVPANTVWAPGTHNSNKIKTKSATDARVFIFVTAIDPGATLDVFVRTSEDGARWVRVRAPNQINAVGDFMVPIEQEKISAELDVEGEVAGGNVTLEIIVERKQGL